MHSLSLAPEKPTSSPLPNVWILISIESPIASFAPREGLTAPDFSVLSLFNLHCELYALILIHLIVVVVLVTIRQIIVHHDNFGKAHRLRVKCKLLFLLSLHRSLLLLLLLLRLLLLVHRRWHLLPCELLLSLIRRLLIQVSPRLVWPKIKCILLVGCLLKVLLVLHSRKLLLRLLVLNLLG